MGRFVDQAQQPKGNVWAGFLGRVVLNATDYSAFLWRVSAKAPEEDVTTTDHNGFRFFTTGLATVEVEVQAYWDNTVNPFNTLGVTNFDANNDLLPGAVEDIVPRGLAAMKLYLVNAEQLVDQTKNLSFWNFPLVRITGFEQILTVRGPPAYTFTGLACGGFDYPSNIPGYGGF